MSKIEFDFSQSKKSTKKGNKKIINLCEKVATLEEFKEMSEKNIFPLVIILKSNNRSELVSDNLLTENYYETSLISNDSSNVYMCINIVRLKENFLNDRLYIDKFITRNGQEKDVYNMYYSNMPGVSTRIGLIKKRKLFLNKNEIEIVALTELIKSIGNEHIKNERKKIILTEEEIDDIHSRGKLTPAEIVKEWESLDLCAPGDAIGSAINRCRDFKYNCHDCLVDFAYYKSEHNSILADLKLVNSYLKDDSAIVEEKGLTLVKKKNNRL